MSLCEVVAICKDPDLANKKNLILQVCVWRNNMCCIFGIGLFNNHGIESASALTGVISRLFKEAESGGRLAAGLSIMREKTAHVLRRPISASELVGSSEYMDFMHENLKPTDESNKLMSIIGHCRWPTQGPPENNLNNHPQVIDNIIGVHNGVISNDHELFKSFEKVITRKAMVDTEIIFQLIKHFNKSENSRTVDAIEKTTGYLVGGYACAMQNTKHPYNLYLFKRGNPITVMRYPKAGIIMFGTRASFMKSAYEDFVEGTGSGKEVDMKDKQGLVFNLWNHTICRFDFKDNNDIKELDHNAG